MEYYSKVRIWEVRFQTTRPLETFPMPHEIVLERQTSLHYHLEGSTRPKTMTQLVVTLEGEGAFRYGDTIYPLTPGKGFMCMLGDPQSAYFYPGHARNPWTFLWMDFSGETAVRMVEELSSLYGHVFDLPLDSGLIRYLKSFRNQRRSIRFVSPTEGARIVCDVLALLGENLERKDIDSPGNRLVQAAQAAISKNLDRTWNLSDIAARLKVSREHLTRIFRDRTGMTPQEFAAEERMQFAVRLLRDSFQSCEEIAEQTGYSSTVSFNRAFRRRFGYSPMQYRKSKMRNLPRNEG
ncbi:MAG: helix-turn-helix domain-containing protein, partial [Lentisphaeria bacterium]|nr:helix-turn-helix domain-containing protein [Lentisphaeria bacterium]